MQPLFSLFLILSLAFPAVQTPQEPGAVFRSTARLIQISVVVKDKNNQPITGLTKNDFTVSDGGKDQVIRSFSVETNEPASGKKDEKLPPNTYTNRVGGKGVPHNIAAVLLDAYNTKAEDQFRARAATVQFLEQIQPGDHVALYTLGLHLIMLHDFTDDSSALLQTLKAYRSGANLGLASAGAGEVAAVPATNSPIGSAADPFAATMQVFQQGLNDMTASTADFASTIHAQDTLNALTAMAHHLQGIPGRKSLVWVSGGFPIRIGLANAGASTEYRSLLPEIDRASKAINAANVAIYPVDANGLLGVDQRSTAQSGAATSTAPTARNAGLPGRNTTGLAETINAAASSPEMDRHSTMNELADRTGGRAFYNRNDITRAIVNVMEDSKVTYMISYTPNHDLWNGNFREIKVKVNKSGAQVLCRKGYLAVPDTPSDNQTRRSALGQAAGAVIPDTGLGLKVGVTREPGQAVMSIEIDTHEIAFAQNNGKYEALVDLLFVFRDADGKAIDQVHQPADLSLSPEDYKRLESTGIGFRLPVPVPAGTTKIRVVARDNASGQVGSVDIPIKP